MENTITVYREDMPEQSWGIFLDSLGVTDKTAREKTDHIELVYSNFYLNNAEGNRYDDTEVVA